MPEERRVGRTALPIRAALRDQMARHAEAAYPDEACGALFGVAGAGIRPLVTRAVPLPNSALVPGKEFRIEPGEIGRACRAAGAQRDSLIGFYHSHPDRVSSPSEFDLDTAMPGTWQVTISVRSGRAGARHAWFSEPPSGREARCRN